MWALKQTATVFEYAQQTDAYIRALAWPESVAVEYFQNGLKSAIQTRLDETPDLDTTNYAGVKRAARRIEQDVLQEHVPQASKVNRAE